jgi:hypothetical protein
MIEYFVVIIGLAVIFALVAWGGSTIGARRLLRSAGYRGDKPCS